MCTKVELTLAILKPPVVAAPHVLQDVKNLILKAGFRVVKSKTGWFTKETAEKFYSEHTGKFFYNRLVTFMTSGPCYFNILEKENAIQDWRTMLGPTKVYKCQFSHPHSIRGRYGLTDTRNVAHGSDSLDSATKEIQLIFPEFDANDSTQQ